MSSTLSTDQSHEYIPESVTESGSVVGAAGTPAAGTPVAAHAAAGTVAAEPITVTVAGQDRPAITTELLGVLGEFGAQVRDISQVVIQGRLVLGVLVDVTQASLELATRLHDWARIHSLDLNISANSHTVIDPVEVRDNRFYVTVMAPVLTAAAVSSITAHIAALGGNIDAIKPLAQKPVTAIEFVISGVVEQLLRKSLSAEASRCRVDIAVDKAGLVRYAKRLIIFDVDSTLITGEVIDMLAARAGKAEEVAAMTERAMQGEWDFSASLKARVELLEGLDVSALDEVKNQICLTPGARELIDVLKCLGYRCGAVSGGFTHITEHLRGVLDLDFAVANTLEIDSGKLTGKVTGPIIDRVAKAQQLRNFAADYGIPLSQTVAVGDGANDIDMITAAGLGIAFNAKPALQAAADVAVNQPSLDTVLYVLGMRSHDIHQLHAVSENASVV